MKKLMGFLSLSLAASTVCFAEDAYLESDCRTYGVPGSDVLPLQVELRFVEARGSEAVDLD